MRLGRKHWEIAMASGGGETSGIEAHFSLVLGACEVPQIRMSGQLMGGAHFGGNVMTPERRRRLAET